MDTACVTTWQDSKLEQTRTTFVGFQPQVLAQKAEQNQLKRKEGLAFLSGTSFLNAFLHYMFSVTV